MILFHLKERRKGAPPTKRDTAAPPTSGEGRKQHHGAAAPPEKEEEPQLHFTVCNFTSCCCSLLDVEDFHCAAEMAPLPRPRIFFLRAARHPNLKTLQNRKIVIN